MLEPSSEPSPLRLPASTPPTGSLKAAKWPPDDDDLQGPPGSSPLGGGGLPDPGDGDFKRGRFNSKAILAGFGIVAVAAVLGVFAMKTEA